MNEILAVPVNELDELDELSDADLESRIFALQLVRNERREARKADFIKQIEDLARAINMSVVLSDIPPEGLTVAVAEAPEKTKRIIHPKYRHPEDETKTWTGRGVAPLWVKAMVEKGHLLESMLINKPADNDQQAEAPVVEPTEEPVVETSAAVAKRSHSKKKTEVKED